ncbi:MAG: hypothetical protein PHW52_01585 [Candidatus Pacebacteria bacterium]|nr:hypothetical protein [Candidatus Paceibacterota bacterium]
MKEFYIRSFKFWFVLLVLAFINAGIREMTYKPFLTPYIGTWAHQISSITGILLFFFAIDYFLKKNRGKYVRKDLISCGVMWILMTVAFETFMNVVIRKLALLEVVKTYYFWNGETWIFVLLSLLVIPLIIDGGNQEKSH